LRIHSKNNNKKQGKITNSKDINNKVTDTSLADELTVKVGKANASCYEWGYWP